MWIAVDNMPPPPDRRGDFGQPHTHRHLPQEPCSGAGGTPRPPMEITTDHYREKFPHNGT
ncbi:hypothetical protein GCM10009564_34410 [Streptomyces thermogriseus]|uniref:Uncharacterized protein n=1 Tax=Streptomyces thermogriseus TaxID=75292 RepID=A0ABN1T1R1_9ACTN